MLQATRNAQRLTGRGVNKQRVEKDGKPGRIFGKRAISFHFEAFARLSTETSALSATEVWDVGRNWTDGSWNAHQGPGIFVISHVTHGLNLREEEVGNVSSGDPHLVVPVGVVIHVRMGPCVARSSPRKPKIYTQAGKRGKCSDIGISPKASHVSEPLATSGLYVKNLVPQVLNADKLNFHASTDR